jgi:hypothetical protein
MKRTSRAAAPARNHIIVCIFSFVMYVETVHIVMESL